MFNYFILFCTERFVRRLCRYFSNGLKVLDFEFSAITDEHLELATLPSTLEAINLNGCREISEKSLI